MKIKTERLNVQDRFGDCKLDYNTVHIIVHGVHSYCYTLGCEGSA